MKYRASDLTIKDVDVAEEREFLNSNHYQGYIASRWCKGLYDGDELIELMSFGIPRFNKKYDYELLRLCTRGDCQVYGGASRLLKHFRESVPKYTSIISYCNESKFSGKVYESLGFEKLSTCKSYHYEKDGVSYHRSQFQRWKLFHLYPQYGDEYTEKDIMQKEGYVRVNEIQGTWVIRHKQFYIYEIEINGCHYVGQHMGQPGDGYTGSGTILRRMQKKYNCTGDMTILLKGIEKQGDADKYEKCAIAICRLVYGSKCINIKDGGQGYQPSDKIHKDCDRAATNKKISKVLKGIRRSEETKRKISESLKIYAQYHQMDPSKRKHLSEIFKKRNALRTQEDFDKISKGLKEYYAKEGRHSAESYRVAAEKRKQFFKEHPERFCKGERMSKLVREAKAEMSRAFKDREDKSITWNQFQGMWKESHK